MIIIVFLLNKISRRLGIPIRIAPDLLKQMTRIEFIENSADGSRDCTLQKLIKRNCEVLTVSESSR